MDTADPIVPTRERPVPRRRLAVVAAVFTVPLVIALALNGNGSSRSAQAMDDAVVRGATPSAPPVAGAPVVTGAAQPTTSSTTSAPTSPTRRVRTAAAAVGVAPEPTATVAPPASSQKPPPASAPAVKSAPPRTSAPPASGIVKGQDVSWPQCPKGMGRGQGKRIPGTVTAGLTFSVIGVTEGGYAFNRNPCVSTLVGYARANGHRMAPYMVPVFPNAAQLAAHGSSGPRDGATRRGRLFNVGFAEGVFAVDAARAAGIDAPLMWVDVEEVPYQPWGTTKPAQAENRLVIEGVLAGIRARGMASGFYSFDYGWKQITGDWRRSEPTWVTVATRGYGNALKACAKRSFSGGPVVLSQWYDHVYDYNLVCPAAGPGALDRYFA